MSKGKDTRISEEAIRMNASTIPQKVIDGKELSPFEAESEEQLFARIDKSLSQLEQGKFQPSEGVEEELLKGLD